MPAKTTRTTAKKPEPQSKPTAANDSGERISYGLMSLVVASFALSLNALPSIRFLSVLFSLAGLALFYMEWREETRVRREFGRGIAGAVLCVFILLLTATRPFWSSRGAPIAQIRTETTPAPIEIAASPPGTTIVDTVPSNPPAVVETPPPVATAPAPAVTAPVPFQTIPFPSGKRLRLVSIPAEIEQPQETQATKDAGKPGANKNDMPPKPPKPIEWIDASVAGANQGEVCVSVASATIERLKLKINGKESASPVDNLVIHLQVVVIGTSRRIDFAPWSNANFGDTRNKPLLKDNLNRTYQLRTFSPGSEIEDRPRPKSLYPRLFANDYLVYDVPANIEFLRLELPATAIGGAGTLRFQIPKSMIEDLRAAQPPK